MRRILYFLIGTGLVVYGWHHYRQGQRIAEDGAPPASSPDPATLTVERPARVATEFRCDGRTRCTEMTSCDEATWFLQHCAGTKMDGDNDGIPCETQWCGR